MHIRWIALLLIAAGFTAAAVRADEFATSQTNELPLWEVGLFTGVTHIPHYPGSDEYRSYLIPAPYFIYRGEFLKADRDGLKGVFWKNARLETGLSLSGNPPVPSDNKARKGMDDLGALIEVGPLLKYFISDRKNPNPFFLTAAIRAAISVDTDDLHTGYEGISGGLKASYRNNSWLKKHDVTLGGSAGIDFANREYNGYFYDVPPADATLTRPAYQADGGYAGFSFSLHAAKKLSEKWTLGAYYRWDNLAGAAYSDSPLVKTENNHIIGCALIWKIHRSEKTVDQPID